jgi:F0F1-type ATP synthase epsilon subunit
MSDAKLLNIRVRDTEHVLYEGQADRVNSYNEMGPFDVYPMHANFISIIKTKLTIYLKKEKLKELSFEQAIMKVKKDVVHIYLGIEIFAIDENDSVTKPLQPQKTQ